MALLEMRGIDKGFGAIRALAAVDFAAEPGEVIGLMGDNGAGKSTLVKIIAGNFPPSRGSMAFGGAELRFTQPRDARDVGIEVVYQDLALADNLSAAANVFLGRELKRRFGPLRRLDHAAMSGHRRRRRCHRHALSYCRAARVCASSWTARCSSALQS